MKKVALTMAVLLFAGLAAAKPKTDPHPLKLVMARQSSVDPVEIIKHLNEKCPNVTITTNPRHSDFMLYAGWGGAPYRGWGGNYRLMVIKHGGDTIYATETVLLSNAVKNVCRFLDSQPAQASAPPPPSDKH